MIAKFPKDFLWGTATSAHQIEGGNIHSDWWKYEKAGCVGACPGGSGTACNHWKLFDEDFRRAESLNNNAHRFSIEWAKVEPEEGKIDKAVLKHYRDVFLSLKKHNLKPFVTLNHFTLPQWVAEKGGWFSGYTVKAYLRFVRLIVAEYSDYVSYWITINEPLVLLYRGVFVGDWPPRKKGFFRFIVSYFRLIHAHRLAYRHIHSHYQKRKQACYVGLAKSVQRFVAHGCGRRDDFIAAVLNYVWNHTFFVFSRGFHDFIGINYYLRQTVCFRFRPPFYVFITEEKDVSDLGWEVYPHGLHFLLADFSRYKAPIYITENGIADSEDKLRCKFIIAHVLEILEAIKMGVDVRGYFHWSLLDNFEWDLGYVPRFGLYAVDFKTQKRTLKESGKVYADICKNNGVTKLLTGIYAKELKRYSVNEICEACMAGKKHTQHRSHI